MTMHESTKGRAAALWDERRKSLADGERVAERLLERRIARRVGATCLIFFPMVAAINASSIATEAERAGIEMDARLPWVLEFTSMAAIMVPIVLLILMQRHRPLWSGGIPYSIAMMLVLSIVFSLLHVGGMAALRAVLVPPITGEEYKLLTDPVRDLLYEYRKDLFPFAVVVALLMSSRRLEEVIQETEAARSEARDTGRITLKDGGRVVLLEAGSVDWAKAAGNYVELHAAGRTYLPRTGLTALEDLLRDAGIDVVRVHRSHIINRSRVHEIAPTGDGDLSIKLIDGSEIRGSRRYRDRLGV
ncbi:LytTR family DNA-binding domain-containing protein [Nitratireductor pacificus]|uniref:Response regulator receiver n=1 Tax=Nitratireductor pacificus pht-3B TaxID=391937 RepID=K2MZS2_9HYPH|nr:LytTR family DNA-binding domain-containing protein [Nitratireductor pacificus]EKF17488.1 response regulator receiver [Nitratireductor pacificus pht-3B]